MASAFNRLCQYASSPGNKTYCYAELVNGVCIAMSWSQRPAVKFGQHCSAHHAALGWYWLECHVGECYNSQVMRGWGNKPTSQLAGVHVCGWWQCCTVVALKSKPCGPTEIWCVLLLLLVKKSQLHIYQNKTLQAQHVLEWENIVTCLLNIAIGRLPHVVVFYDALQRFPRQLRQHRKMC